MLQGKHFEKEPKTDYEVKLLSHLTLKAKDSVGATTIRQLKHIEAENTNLKDKFEPIQIASSSDIYSWRIWRIFCTMWDSQKKLTDMARFSKIDKEFNNIGSWWANLLKDSVTHNSDIHGIQVIDYAQKLDNFWKNIYCTDRTRVIYPNQVFFLEVEKIRTTISNL